MTNKPQSFSDLFRKEIELASQRQDLLPGEPPQEGFSLAKHDLATIASSGANSVNLNLPPFKPAVK